MKIVFAWLSHLDGGMLLEQVSVELTSTFETWWAGGSFG